MHKHSSSFKSVSAKTQLNWTPFVLHYSSYMYNGLFQKVKIHPHGRLLINLNGFLDKISLFPDGLARALNFMDC